MGSRSPADDLNDYDRLLGIGATLAWTGADGPEYSHHPFARRLKVSWRRDDAGRWVADAEDPHEWEVICPECGDSDGPRDELPESLRRLRGPYRSERRAKHAATKHFRAWSPKMLWTPGGGLPGPGP